MYQSPGISYDKININGKTTRFTHLSMKHSNKAYTRSVATMMYFNLQIHGK